MTSTVGIEDQYGCGKAKIIIQPTEISQYGKAAKQNRYPLIELLLSIDILNKIIYACQHHGQRHTVAPRQGEIIKYIWVYIYKDEPRNDKPILFKRLQYLNAHQDIYDMTQPCEEPEFKFMLPDVVGTEFHVQRIEN